MRRNELDFSCDELFTYRPPAPIILDTREQPTAADTKEIPSDSLFVFLTMTQDKGTL